MKNKHSWYFIKYPILGALFCVFFVLLLINFKGNIFTLIANLSESSLFLKVNYHYLIMRAFIILCFFLLGLLLCEPTIKYLRKWKNSFINLNFTAFLFFYLLEGFFVGLVISIILFFVYYPYYLSQLYLCIIYNFVPFIFGVLVSYLYKSINNNKDACKLKSEGVLFQRPIKDSKEDLLGRDAVISQLMMNIDDCINNKDDNGTIALVGSHGSGKTSIVNLLYEKYEHHKNKYAFVEFRPVEYSDNHKQLAYEFYKKIVEKIKENYPIPCLSHIPQDYVDIFFNLPKFPLFNILKILFNKTDYKKLKSEIEKVLSFLDISVIVVIDEIDRCPAATLLLFLRLIQNIGRINNIVYVFAIEPDDFEKKTRGTDKMVELLHGNVEVYNGN